MNDEYAERGCWQASLNNARGKFATANPLWQAPPLNKSESHPHAI